ncbi:MULTISPECIES: type II toxin-antitoxin system prevent-host-death family antitoxin [unclassified Rhizobium]|uniref:type II toxin-antitoxin system Phd/YefM family antitoxin n=1 Tax=unclassified Rhizobium TaxID=2613769 RepID=UPI000A5EAE68|nr:type II toxin-antitoxin system prevent-host-death family antitoxin [Rhizobium sp. Root274]
MTVVTIHKAKTELSKLLARVEAGEEIVIARAGMSRLRSWCRYPRPKRRTRRENRAP